MDKPFVKTEKLKKYFYPGGSFFTRGNVIKAVDDINLDIYKGESFGLAGESGCGKTTMGKTILGLYKPDGGRVIFDGKTLTSKNIKHYKKRMQMIFQDPYSSLDPLMTVEDIVGEALDIHRIASGKKRHEMICGLLETAGLDKNHMNRFPRQLSGGERQRAGIARALAVNPEFIVCDEPVTSLDNSIQARIIDKLAMLQEKMGLTYLFIAHDLAVMKYICQRTGIMYMGKIVEMAKSRELYTNPAHPYTKDLISSIPSAETDRIAKGEEVTPRRGMRSAMHSDIRIDTPNDIRSDIRQCIRNSERISAVSSSTGSSTGSATRDDGRSIRNIIRSGEGNDIRQGTRSGVKNGKPNNTTGSIRRTEQGCIKNSPDYYTGCGFKSECSQKMKICQEKQPELKEIAPGHFCACHLY